MIENVKMPDGYEKTTTFSSLRYHDDELCRCGHLQTEHDEHIVPGHGSCKHFGCKCRKFTWFCFVNKVEKSC